MEYFLILMTLLTATFAAQMIFKIRIYRDKKQMFLTVGLFLLVGTVWDSWAIYRGHWIYSAEQLLGIKIGLMPLEEYLFILIVPYFVLVFYQLLSGRLRKDETDQ